MILGRCDLCKLMFHTVYGVDEFDNAVEGCECRHPTCGCRLKREKK